MDELGILACIDFFCRQINESSDSVVVQNLWHSIRHLVSVIEHSTHIGKSTCLRLVCIFACKNYFN
jgi:hypothetical protein